MAFLLIKSGINMRSSNRSSNQMRTIKITRNYTKHAEGSVLIEFGNTIVLCNATIEEGVPRFLKGQNKGWITAEYGMLPRATHSRTQREAAKGKQTGRTMEIQRLIGRSLRAAVDLNMLGEFMITIDCDVIQADGGTRTAAISGACVALYDALASVNKHTALKSFIAAVSVGVVNQTLLCDLEYSEDSNAETDMNIVMTEDHRLIEIQGTAESEPFSQDELVTMLSIAQNGIDEIILAQKKSLHLI